MSQMQCDAIQFPSKNSLISCLSEHPLTGVQVNPWATEKGVYDAVADFFANQCKAPQGINLGLLFTFLELDCMSDISEMAVFAIMMNFQEALTECAGRSITAEQIIL